MQKRQLGSGDRGGDEEELRIVIEWTGAGRLVSWTAEVWWPQAT